ncbi:DUF1127 domain-containing protein [Microvirga guangxiensis]|uniref:DUF1127 domain-containing protein n=1 Tax=Microvirga guangxiensis TaxID=549386 RepID=A0A1G5JY16_9HYPH|nr:DUF1127 domain-containing protein [Microvirga guangxiensis]SCY92811.1 protein of unknown function [Microvirga guangxiensis]
MLTLLSSFLGRERPVATHRELLSLRDLDDHLLRDIGLRRIELHVVPVERLLPACCSGATRRWAEFVARLRNTLSPQPVPCCQS